MKKTRNSSRTAVPARDLVRLFRDGEEAAAKAIGVSESTIRTILDGKPVNLRTLAKVILAVDHDGNGSKGLQGLRYRLAEAYASGEAVSGGRGPGRRRVTARDVRAVFLREADEVCRQRVEAALAGDKPKRNKWGRFFTEEKIAGAKAEMIRRRGEFDSLAGASSELGVSTSTLRRWCKEDPGDEFSAAWREIRDRGVENKRFGVNNPSRERGNGREHKPENGKLTPAQARQFLAELWCKVEDVVNRTEGKVDRLLALWEGDPPE